MCAKKDRGGGEVDKVLAWIRELLTRRRQKLVLVFSGNLSERGEVKSGIVLVSVLGPVLLLIFIKDFKVVARCEEG